MYIYIPHFAYPVQAPSVTVDSIALRDRTKGSLPDETRRNENDINGINGVDTNEEAGRKDNNE